MAAGSLRAHLLRLLLPPIAALLGLGAGIAYFPSIDPAIEVYDQSLADVGVALGSHIRAADEGYRLELPPAVQEQVLFGDAGIGIREAIGKAREAEWGEQALREH